MRRNAVRLHKYLADRGIGSRRRCELYIKEGRVSVNGMPVTALGTAVNPDRDTVEIDGRAVGPDLPTTCTILINKPRGYICTTSAKQGNTVLDLVKTIEARLVPVGRLDKDSEGLLLISNDGDLVNRMTHPRFDHEKTYWVTVSGPVNSATVKALGSRMLIDGYRIMPARVKVLKRDGDTGRVVLEMVLKEGRNRQIRKMCNQASLKIHRLVRVRIGKLALSGLKTGKWRKLSDSEIQALKG